MRSKWWPAALKLLFAAGIVFVIQRNLPLNAADLLQFYLHAKVSFYISMVMFAIFLMLQAGIWVLIVNTASRAVGTTAAAVAANAPAPVPAPTNATATAVAAAAPRTAAIAATAELTTAAANAADDPTDGGRPVPWPQLGLLQGLRLFINSQFAKYIPGGFWNYAGRIVLATRAGVPLAAQLSAIVYENVLLVLAACTYALLLAVELSRAPGLLVGGALAAALALYAGYAPLTALLGRAFAAASGWKPLQPLLQRLKLRQPPRAAAATPSRPAPPDAQAHAARLRPSSVRPALLSRNQFFAGWGCFLASHFVMGIAFWLLCNSFGAGRITLLYAAGTFATSWLLGLLSPLPGGLGVREGFLVYFLSLKLGTEAAMHISVIARVWNIMAEVTFWIIIQFISRLARKVRWHEA